MEKTVSKNPKCYLSALLITIACFAALDGFYIGVLGRNHWSQQIQSMNHSKKTNIRWFPAIIAYILMIAAILLFVVKISENPWWGLLWGALLGLIVYGIFNFTNLAIFTNYQWTSALIDTSWGILLFGVTGALATLTAEKWIIIK